MFNEKDLQDLSGKTLLVTGATGLIGSNVIKYLLQHKEIECKIIALVRNADKAEKVFKTDVDKIELIVGDVTDKECINNINQQIDFIIHAASFTSSKQFVENPVEVIDTSINGTVNLLELAKKNNVKGFVYTSSMEVYGTPSDDEKISESHNTNIDTMETRASYPESKRMCEAICRAYFSEYNVSAKIARLTQTFGEGVSYNDGRVFAEFARCAIEKRDIVLHTKGQTKRNYLYTSDAVNAILAILLRGQAGEAYNVANEDTYCTIYDMAEMVAKECAGNDIKVVVETTDDIEKFGYAKTLHMNLDCSKLRGLGWEAQVGLEEMFERLIKYMKENR